MKNAKIGENTTISKEKLILEVIEDMEKVGKWIKGNDDYLRKNGSSMSKEELGKYVLSSIEKLTEELNYKILGPSKLNDILYIIIQQNRGVYNKQIGLAIDGNRKFSVISRVLGGTYAK
jgi:hypothetical protein